MGQEIIFTTTDSPVGELLLTSNGDAITGLFMEQFKVGPKMTADWRRDASAFREAVRQLRAYFAGELTEFDLPLATRGTEFQKRVWNELCGIDYGTTINYAELARWAGRPAAVRAAGAANGSNPVSIIIPCHRVIGSNGKLTGYGGGIERKKFLIELEAGVLRKSGRTVTSLS
jgi:methylated-DNA-[protein]-cysteine S-methyltransferase